MPASASFTLVQSAVNTACGTSVTTCTITTSAVTVGNMGVVVMGVGTASITISSVSGCGGIWQHATAGNVSDATAGSTDLFYALYLSSACTSVVVTFSGTVTGAQAEFVEYSHTQLGVTFDNAGNVDRSVATTSPAGPSIGEVNSITGYASLTVQYIKTAGTVSAISGSFTNPADFNTTLGVAGWIAATNGTGPTWTTTNARAAVGGAAFRETTGYTPDIANWDQAPYLVQSSEFNVGTLAFPQAVINGDVLEACWGSTNQTSDPTFSDAFGLTWTVQCHQTTTSPELYCATAKANATGTDTVSVSASGTSGQQMALMEWRNVTDTLDTCSASTFTWSSQATTMPNVTTTAYRDLVQDIIFHNSSQVISENENATVQYVPAVASGTNRNLFVQYLVPNANPGTVTGPTMQAVNAVTGTKMVIALKPAANLTVSTGAIPDAIQSQTYNFQMQAVGGAGTNVWSITSGSLPLGLSLSSGGNISGTCTNSNPNTITFQAADSASATATKGLTLKCATSASTIAKINSASPAGNCTETPTSTGFSATSGNLLMVTLMGAQNPLFSRVLDGLGTIYHLLPNVGFNNYNNATTTAASLGAIYWGIAGSSGALSIACDRGQANSSTTWAPIEVVEFSNVQNIFDTYVAAMNNSTAGGNSSSNTITAPVSETLYAYTNPGTNGATITAQSPFTAVSNSISGGSHKYGSASEIGASQGSNSETWTLSGNTSNRWSATIFGFRPKTSGTAPAAGGARKKGPFGN